MLLDILIGSILFGAIALIYRHYTNKPQPAEDAPLNETWLDRAARNAVLSESIEEKASEKPGTKN